MVSWKTTTTLRRGCWTASNTFPNLYPNSALNLPKQSLPGSPTRSPLPTGNPTLSYWCARWASVIDWYTHPQGRFKAVRKYKESLHCFLFFSILVKWKWHPKNCRNAISAAWSSRPMTPSTTVVPAEKASVMPAPPNLGPCQRGAGASLLFECVTPVFTTGRFQQVTSPLKQKCVFFFWLGSCIL